MANVKISDLPSATSFGATDVVPIVQSGITKKVAGSLISVTSTNVVTTTVSTIQQMVSANVPAGNCYMTASVASSAITIALKTLAGSDATTTDAITFVLRNSTITNGSLTAYTLSGALTTVISSGSTLGCGSSEQVRIHVGAMLNASTGIELFYWTAAVAASTSIKRFDQTEFITTTAEGGAGAADSAQTAYSTTARTSQPWTYMGYIEATSSATAGQWSSIDKIVNWQPGVPMPGDIVRRERAFFPDSASTTTTFGVTGYEVPQNTYGAQFMQLAWTAKSVMNRAKIIWKGTFSHSVADAGVNSALFQDSVAAALRAGTSTGPLTAEDATGMGLTLFHELRIGTTSEVTYKIRAREIG